MFLTPALLIKYDCPVGGDLCQIWVYHGWHCGKAGSDFVVLISRNDWDFCDNSHWYGLVDVLCEWKGSYTGFDENSSETHCNWEVYDFMCFVGLLEISVCFVLNAVSLCVVWWQFIVLWSRKILYCCFFFCGLASTHHLLFVVCIPCVCLLGVPCPVDWWFVFLAVPADIMTLLTSFGWFSGDSNKEEAILYHLWNVLVRFWFYSGVILIVIFLGLLHYPLAKLASPRARIISSTRLSRVHVIVERALMHIFPWVHTSVVPFVHWDKFCSSSADIVRYG